MKILVMNGINLGMLGIREPGKYGSKTYKEITEELSEFAKTKNNLTLDFFVTDIEGEFVRKLYEAREKYDGVVMNCGAWSHYSIGIRDAISGSGVKAVDVHMTNVYAREEFRHNQVIAPVCIGQISGFGEAVYRLAVEALMGYIEGQK